MTPLSPSAISAHPGRSLGKYREIVLAVACFLVFDLAVLVLNFYTSFEIAGDASAINLAGRQRMLSQRMTKSLLQHQHASGTRASDAALDELRDTVRLFDTTLGAFRNGGAVVGGDGQVRQLAPVSSSAAREVLARADAIWRPYTATLTPVLKGTASPAQLDTAIRYASEHNLALLTQMNALTTALEAQAAAKADRLRGVQTGGIVLALANFAFILFKFVRRLRASDLRTEQAQRETSEILATVKEGLFLLDHDGRVAGQHSASLAGVLRHELSPGSNFLQLAEQRLPRASYETARDYIELLFGDRVKESLVQSLNPLAEVQFGNDAQAPWLAFRFNRVRADGRTAHLLVTVADVSERVRLGQALEAAKARNRQDIEVLLDLLRIDPPALTSFLQRAEHILLEVNDRLRAAPDHTQGRVETLLRAFRSIHTLKGEAATLGLSLFETLAHEIEVELSAARTTPASGAELLTLAVRLDEMFRALALVQDMLAKLSAHRAFETPDATTGFIARLRALAERIARDQHKQVELDAQIDHIAQLPPSIAAELRDIAVQLVRNAVAHGIEAPTERAGRAKPPAGSIFIACEPTDEGYEFVLRDDGRGLSPAAIRDALIASGRYSAAQLAELDDRQIVMKIFEPGFTTATQATPDAGHGVGMDVVKEKIMRLGGHLRIVTEPSRYTEFRIRFGV